MKLINTKSACENWVVVYLHDGNSGLGTLLDKGDVICHPFIIGELACGNLKNRSEILSLMQALPNVISSLLGLEY
ncbi:MAG: hypothetical protein AB1743_06370 [Actinomycetota bacterium]